MTLTELFNKYTFHDSSLEAIRFNQNHNSLEMDIDFCFWMQTDYVKTSPETGMIELIFNGVLEFVGEPCSYNDLTILDTIVSDHNKLTFQILDEDDNKYMELTVISESVEFVVK
jgi:hypothetical protein